MARDEDMERRLNNWARWQLGLSSGPLGFASPSLESFVVTSGYREAVVPTVDCEAEETDRGVQQLDAELQRTLRAVYIGAGSMVRKAEELGIGERTMQMRIARAHYQLSAWLVEQRERLQMERARVQSLVRR